MQKSAHPMTAILGGTWRAQPGVAEVSEASLTAFLPVLISAGASGLAWNKVKHNADLCATEPAQELRQYARMLALDVARQEAGLSALFRLMQGAGFAPLLFKGWAVAQYYDALHLRAMGDVDLCAPSGRFDELADFFSRQGFIEITRVSGEVHGRAVLLAAPADWPSKRLLVDLHERFDRFAFDELKEVFARARSLKLEGISLPTPALEDHLRILAVHFLRDGGWRAPSLCDIGAVLERVPSDFDWELCLGTHPRRRRWIAASFELAHVLLGARLDAMPQEYRLRNVPGWLSATVLRAWEKPFSHHAPRISFGKILRRHPAHVLSEIRARWPNAVRASMELDAELNWLPRWPYQLLYLGRAAGRFGWHFLADNAQRTS